MRLSLLGIYINGRPNTLKIVLLALELRELSLTLNSSALSNVSGERRLNSKNIRSLKNILLVEDDPNFANIVVSSLQCLPTSPQITHAQSLSEARDQIALETPDLVITDVNLPDGLGTDLLSTDGELIPFPIIVMTGGGDEQLATQSMKRGAMDYMVKGEGSVSEIPHVVERAYREWTLVHDQRESEAALKVSEGKLSRAYDQLRLILKGTAHVAGQEFLRSLTQYLAEAMGVPYAGIGEISSINPEKIQILSYWNGDKFGPNFEYDLAGTPCQVTIEKGFSCYSESLKESFPEDADLVNLNAESYMGVMLYDYSRKPMGVVWVIDEKPFGDLTNLKEILSIFATRAENEMRIMQAERERDQFQQVSDAALNNVVDGIITIDEKGIICSANPAAETIFGYPGNEIIGTNVKRLMPEPYRSEHDQYLKNYLHTGNRKIIGFGREVEGLRKDGSVFPLDLAVSEMYVGEKRMFTGITRDLSEAKKAEHLSLRFGRILENSFNEI